MPSKEATTRIKINKLFEAAGGRFFMEGGKPANIRLEPGVTVETVDLDVFGDNFEKTGKGFIDFLLLDARGFPLLVLEAKSESKDPLVGKEQARKYARSQNCRFVMLSNGNLHYFWDLERGNPYLVTSFPTPESVAGYRLVTPNPQRLVEDTVNDDYIVLTQRPGYQSEAAWRTQSERPAFNQTNKLRFLRPYQLAAIHTLQRAVKDGRDRFLHEMATGTGKTLAAAAVIFLNAILVASKDHWKTVANSTRKDPNITKTDVLNFKLPLPPLATQQAIVAEIEAEQALVAANRELITRFEKKIHATLARIWGEVA